MIHAPSSWMIRFFMTIEPRDAMADVCRIELGSEMAAECQDLGIQDKPLFLGWCWEVLRGCNPHSVMERKSQNGVMVGRFSDH